MIKVRVPDGDVQATEREPMVRNRPSLSSELKSLRRFVARVKAWMSNADFIDTAIENKAFVQTALSNLPLVDAVLSDTDFIERAVASRRNEVCALDAFQLEFKEFAAMPSGRISPLPVEWESRFPCLDDRVSATPLDRHYLYHPAWAARVLARTRPERHVDISSTVNFCAIISAFIPVDFYDYRPAPIVLDGLYAGAADLTALPFSDNSIRSLSCMHVLEHIGLGRYGEPLDPDGDLKAIAELVRVLAPGGDLLVATPVGKARIQFNAHRVYDHEAFRVYFEPLEIVEFAWIADAEDGGGLILNPPPELVRAGAYGCGCFWLRKPPPNKG